MAEKILTQELLHSLFDYRDGNLYWKVTRGNGISGKIAGHKDKNEYLSIGIFGKSRRAHKLIYLYHHGYIPEFVDHINNIRDDNRIENLREATRSENNQNAKKRKDNSSGVKGVHFCKRDQRYVVRVQVNEQRLLFGYFKDLELAELVAIEARDKYHKEFARN